MIWYNNGVRRKGRKLPNPLMTTMWVNSKVVGWGCKAS